jgi:hypothetical protein
MAAVFSLFDSVLASSLTMMTSSCTKSAVIICHVASSITLYSEISATIQPNFTFYTNLNVSNTEHEAWIHNWVY